MTPDCTSTIIPETSSPIATWVGPQPPPICHYSLDPCNYALPPPHATSIPISHIKLLLTKKSSVAYIKKNVYIYNLKTFILLYNTEKQKLGSGHKV